MKRNLTLMMIALVSCLETGCIIGSCKEVREEHTRSYASFDFNPIVLALDLVTMPIGMVCVMSCDLYWLGCQKCEDWFFDYPGTRESRGRCWQQLDKEVHMGRVDPYYLVPFDDQGSPTEAYYVFSVYMDNEENVIGMARQNANYYAKRFMEDPQNLEKFPNLWVAKSIQPALRRQALEVLRGRSCRNKALFEKILDNECFSDVALEKIMATSPNQYESQAAFNILSSRLAQLNAE